MDNLNIKIKSFMSLTLDNLINDIKEILNSKREISILEINSLKKYLDDILNLNEDYKELLTPEIIIKINEIQHLFKNYNGEYKDKITHLNT
jgi:hypothetical protein